MSCLRVTAIVDAAFTRQEPIHALSGASTETNFIWQV
jgi:hypothetical protein